MTDDAERYLRDIEAAAAALGAMPDDYRILRGLLASLPPGTAPVLKPGGAAALGALAGAGGIDTTGLTLQSNQAIGSQSGGSLGILPQSFYGQTNVIQNPELVVASQVCAAAGVAYQAASNWLIRYVLNSGADVPNQPYLEDLYSRGNNANPFNSQVLELGTNAPSAAARDLDIYLYQATPFFPIQPTSTNLTASVRISNVFGSTVAAHWTTAEAILEIVRSSDGAVVASSTPLNLHVLDGLYETRQLQASTAQTGAAFRATGWTWRLRLHLVSDGSAAIAGRLFFGEPQLSFTTTAEPAPYAPILGSWFPDRLKAFGYASNGLFSVFEIFSGSSAGRLKWGPGTATHDIQLQRSGTKELTINDAVNGPVRMKHVGPHFVQGPTAMDLAITYGADGPTNVSRADEGVNVSSSVIAYAAGKVSSIVTTRFGKTITTIPTYTGANITSVARDVT